VITDKIIAKIMAMSKIRNKAIRILLIGGHFTATGMSSVVF